MQELINQLITTGVGLGLLGGAYLIWLLTGVANNLFSVKKWSWKRMLEDIAKTLLMGAAILAWVGLCYGIEWFAAKCNCDIKALMDGASVAGVIGGIIGGTIMYAVKAYKNIINFVNASHVDAVTGEINYGEVTKKITDFIETITRKTDKEQIAEDGGEELVGEEINEIEAGKGGIDNSYPEPYKSAGKDTIIDPSTCYNRECVSYTAWKIAEATGKWPRRTGDMNAKNWIYRLPENGYKEVSAPKEGGKYVGISTSGTYGHALWYEFDNTISEYNYASLGNFSVRTTNLSQYRWFEIVAPAVDPTPVPTPTPTTKKVKYTYKSGDTFGQVILNLGLNTSHGLWGTDGDVVFYTKQLNEQGIVGNIPVGTTITLTPRK